MTHSEFLNWIAERMVNVYGESEQVDFVTALRRRATEIANLEAKLAESEAERMEQARLNGMGSEREARLLSQLTAHQAALKVATDTLGVYAPMSEAMSKPAREALAAIAGMLPDQNEKESQNDICLH